MVLKCSGNAHMSSTPSHRSFPNVAFETSSNVCLTDSGPVLTSEGRSSTAGFFYASLLQVIDGVVVVVVVVVAFLS